MMLSTKPTGAALGAEILGVDLSRELDDATFRAIVAAFHEYEVVFFRNQTHMPRTSASFTAIAGGPAIF